MAIKIFHPDGSVKQVTLHAPITLRGDEVRRGLIVQKGTIAFLPRWGMTRASADCMAVVDVKDPPDEYRQRSNVGVVLTDTMPVIVPVKAGTEAERELVLVQEYQTGTGAKRFPDFSVNLDENQILVLARESTRGGSGGETWTLVSAPRGWSVDIADQFVNARDVPSETITSRLECERRAKC